ncbi:MAG: winged helix-turn-helix transcriptional regulator [Thermoplasmata archaeon]
MTHVRKERGSGTIRVGIFLPMIALVVMSLAPFLSQGAEARPSMSVDMSVSDVNLEPMDVFKCTIFFDNNGHSSAPLVWINVTIPDGVMYLSDDSGMERGVKEGDYIWRFPNIAEGEHTFEINMQVSADVREGDITIISHLDYLDDLDIPMPSSEAVVTLSVAGSAWNLADPVAFNPGGTVGIVKDIKPSKSKTSVNSTIRSVGHEIGDSTPIEGNEKGLEDPTPPPPVTDPVTSLPGDGMEEPGIDTGTAQDPIDQTHEPSTDPIDPSHSVATVEEDTKQSNEQPDSYTDYNVPTEDVQPTVSPATKIEPSKVSSEIVSNDKVYGIGDVISFTIYLNNTGSQTASRVWVELVIPSSVRLVDDTSSLIGGRALGELVYVFFDIGPGNHEFVIYLTFEGEVEEPTEVEIWAHVSYTDSLGGFVGESSHRAKTEIVAQPGEFPLMQVSFAILSAGLMTVVVYSAKEWGTYSLLPFIPLYSRLNRREVMNHEARGMIIGFIKENPGEHFNSLKSKLDFRNGTLAHHLHILEREKVIKSVRYGKYRRFFPVGMMVSSKAYPTELEREILGMVKERPGINQMTIAKKVGRSKSTVNYHIDILRRTNKIRTEKNGLSLGHYIIES